MKTMSRRFIHSLAFLIVASCFLLIGCSSNFATNMRQVTYPPEFTYTSKTELRSEMANLAQQMILLERALAEFPEDDLTSREEQREQVLIILKNMGRIASRLRAGNAGANHPFMDDYMQTFIAKVDKARGAATIDPPRLYYAAKVSGACTACHKVNRD